jgi:hypothetical protein
VKKDLGVYTAFGRWMAIPNANSEDPAVVAACERCALNFPTQGCLTYDSLVTTNKGLKKIGELAQTGETVQVWTGSVWAEATSHSMGKCQLAEITLSDGTTIRCDTRHKQLVVTEAGYSWTNFEDLRVRSKSATSLCYPVEFEPPPMPEVEHLSRTQTHPNIQGQHEELFYWLGRYVGDGYLGKTSFCYCFGAHEIGKARECQEFWESCGVHSHLSTNTHTPKNKSSTRHQVVLSSVELSNFLISLGISRGVTAHTKRLPSRIFQETLENRKSFIRGVMDSDGHKPPMVSAKGNPYNIHLCQRPLLEDLKILLRTLGVESIIRGPYRSGSDKNGDDTTSYRLDINRRMFERNIEGVANRGPRFNDMFAPRFLVKEFLKKGPWKAKDFRDNSSYVLYRRLATGGKVTVYTFDDLCRQVGVTLSKPVYGYKRIKKIKILPKEEETYTLSVNDPLHRFEADGVITKNSAADIMKIIMIMLYKEFFARGWIQAETARFLLTVHDELVFEVKHEALMEAMPVIERIMTEPGRIKKDWPVKLEVEPLIDLHWDPRYDFHKITKGYIPEKGKSPKKTDIKVGDRYYQPVPEWLVGLVTPDYVTNGITLEENSPGVILPPAIEGPIVVTEKPPEPLEMPPRAPSAPPSSPSSHPKEVLPNQRILGPLPSKNSSKDQSEGVFTYHLSTMTPSTARQVASVCISCLDPDGKLLQLLDQYTNEPLIEQTQGIRINVESFRILMQERNL